MVITDKLTVKVQAKWIRYLMAGLGALLLSWCAFVQELRPMGGVLLCIAIKDKRYFTAVLIGALTGSFIGGLQAGMIALSCLPVLFSGGILFILRGLRRMGTAYKMGAVLLSYGLTALIATGVDYDYILLALNALAACGLIPLAQVMLDMVIGIREKERLSPKELICINILACMLILSVPQFDFWEINSFGVLGCMYISIAGACFGAGGGASAGSLLAFLAAFKTGSYEMALVMASGGMLAGLLKDMRRIGPPLGIFMADLIFTLMLERDFSFILSVSSLILGCLPVILISDKIYGKLYAVCASTVTGVNLATRVKEENAQKLSAISGVLADVGRIFKSAQTDGRARRAALCGIAASEVCSQCEKYDYCWKTRYADTYGDFKQLASLVFVVGTVSPCDVPAALKGRCHSWVQVLISMNVHNERLLEEEPEKKESTIALECDSIAHILDSLSADNLVEAEYDERMEQELSRSLKERGIEVREIVCRKWGNQTEIQVIRPACKRGKECTGGILAELKKLTGMQFICDCKKCNASGEKCVSSFIPLPRLKVTGYAAGRQKEGERVCGDTFSLKPLKGGKYLAAVSDGMGSGEKALIESEKAISLAETLLEGGVDTLSSYSLINQLLYLSSEREGYSTLDACVLDLNDGVMEWGKIGACPGYILREGKALSYESASLPVGIVDDVKPGIIKKLVRGGDVIVLVSDGVYDALVGNEDRLKGYLEGNSHLEIKDLAKGLLGKALEAYSGKAKDDMTVVAVRVTA